MTGIHLLLLAVFALLARCQQRPQVSISPKLKQIFSGDLIFLRCDTGIRGSEVKWYFDDGEQTLTNETWKIGVAAPEHSGSYQCESNGAKSDRVLIEVLEYVPTASLTIKTGQPVERRGGSVILQLDNEDGLQGWNCWFSSGGPTMKIQMRMKRNDSVTKIFQSNRLNVPETIFWCSDTQDRRSNQITVRTSEKAVSLEMYPLPPVIGESLTLKCLVWGTDQISHAVFYKDNTVIQNSVSPTYKITSVTESTVGSYKCDATYTYRGRTAGPPYQVESDNQDVFVQAPPFKAVLSGNTRMACSCPRCPVPNSYQWYYKKDQQPWVRLGPNQGSMMPSGSGTYACRAVWDTGRSLLSNAHSVSDPKPLIIILTIVAIVLVLGLGTVFLCIYYKKRNTTVPIYEDMPVRRKAGDDSYEMLKKGAQREAEYDALHPEAAGRKKKEGEYEALKKEEMTGEVYHTLGMEGATGGEAGYEALKKKEMTGGVYHTLGMEGATGGEAGYEALKKKEMTGGVYHTLGMEGATGGEGGYEALKKKEMTGGVYNTLKMEGATGGEGGYEALKKEEMTGGVYNTLKMENAGGGE